MNEGWNTAADSVTDMIQWHSSSRGREYMNGFIESYTQAAYFDPDLQRYVDRDDPEFSRNDQAIEAYVGFAVRSLPHCEPMYVAPDMCELIAHAAQSWRKEPFRAGDAICPHGAAWLAQPIQVEDAKGIPLVFRVMQWNEVDLGGGPGLMLALYCSPRDNGDPRAWISSHGTYETPLISHLTGIEYGNPNVDTGDSADRVFSYFATLFRLCQQQIVVTSHERLARPVWKRASHWRQIKEMVVFTLRRPKSAHYEGDERHVEWSHRWMVNGHWRNQPYKENGQTVYRQIWIAPYIKGPDNKPIVFKRRAFELVR